MSQPVALASAPTSPDTPADPAPPPADSPLWPSQSRFGAHLVTSQFAGISPATATLPRSDLALSLVRVRPVLALAWGAGLRFEAAVDAVVLQGTGPGLMAQSLAIAPQNRLRWRDFSPDAWSSRSFALQTNLDRLSVHARLGAWSLTLGRQVIGHGAARLLPSADLFGPFGPGAIATEFKRGIDALRLTRPIGQDLEIEAIAVAHRRANPGERPDTGLADGLYLLRLGGSWSGWLDASLLAGLSYRLATLGFSMNGDILGAGWYLEGSGRFAGTSRADLAGRNWHARATAGLDRQWGERTRTLVEFAWQSHGAQGSSGLIGAYSALPRVVGESYLVGRWYAAALVSRQVADLHSAQLAAIANLSDSSTLLLPGIGLSVADEVTLGLGALIPVGQRPLAQFAGVPLPRSEFGAMPFLGYLDLRLAW